MEKPAAVDHPVDDLIRQRWSPRSYSERPVAPETLRSLFEAARWAPSCFNEQPWRFIVATRDDPADYARMLDCLVPGNQNWAKSAPVLMLSTAKLTFDMNGNANRHALHDVGMASAQLAVQATALGLSVHFMAGFDADKARLTYGVPEDYELVAACAIGYGSTAEDVPEGLRESEFAPRQRLPLADTVFSRAWNSAAPATA